MRKESYSIGTDEAELIAARGLGYLAESGEQLIRFMELTGLTVETLRKDAREQHVLVSVLDHIVSDDSLLLAFASVAAIQPERVVAAHARLSKSADVYRST